MKSFRGLQVGRFGTATALWNRCADVQYCRLAPLLLFPPFSPLQRNGHFFVCNLREKEASSRRRTYATTLGATSNSMEEKDVSAEFAEGKKSFYEILGVEQTASASEIKRAYYKLALKYHPDRVKTEDEGEKEKANTNFQTLGKIYETLSDPKRRQLYDATGEALDDDLFKDKDWDQHWRSLFPPVTLNDIANYEKKYKGSQMQRDDILNAYKQGKGSMTFIMENVILSSWDDEKRFRDIIEAAINKAKIEREDEQSEGEEEEDEEVDEEKENKKKKPAKKAQGGKKGTTKSAAKGKATKAAEGTKRKRKADRDESAEAEQLAKVLGINITTEKEEDSLKALITSNQNKAQARFNSLIAGLEAKYSPPPKRGRQGGKRGGGARGGGRQRKVEQEPSEEEFEAARQRLEARRKKGTSS